MSRLKLVIANKNVSSWSMRPWVLLSEAGIEFEEVLVPFGAPEWKARVGSPSGRVPLLVVEAVVESGASGTAGTGAGGAAARGDGVHAALRIWDSLAICEYVAEQFPEKKLWPEERDARAVAESVCSEMHSSFADLRRECSMNLMLRSNKELSPAASADVRRVDALFADCRARFGSAGELLFGRFSIADAMFAPVASRVRTYGLKLSPASQRYVDALWSLPSVRRWAEAAKAEVAAGIIDPVSHGALFSRGEAERIGRRWIDDWNANQLESRLSLCAEGVRAGGELQAQGRAALHAAWAQIESDRAQARAGSGPEALRLDGFAWDGDANLLTLQLSSTRAGADQRRVELLAFDSSGLVASIDSYRA